MKFLLGTFVLVIFVGSAMAQVTAVPVSSEPDHHQVIENEYTRVFYVEVPAGKQTLLHEHQNDYVFVTLGDSDIENTPQAKAPIHQQFKDGEFRYVKAPLSHVAKNLASTPFRNVTIEVLRPGDAGAEERTNQEISSVHVDTMTNQKVIVSKYAGGPSGSFSMKGSNSPSLLVAVGDTKITTKNDQNLMLHAGEVNWIASGTEFTAQAHNSKPLQFVVVQFK